MYFLFFTLLWKRGGLPDGPPLLIASFLQPWPASVSLYPHHYNVNEYRVLDLLQCFDGVGVHAFGNSPRLLSIRLFLHVLLASQFTLISTSHPRTKSGNEKKGMREGS